MKKKKRCIAILLLICMLFNAGFSSDFILAAEHGTTFSNAISMKYNGVNSTITFDDSSSLYYKVNLKKTGTYTFSIKSDSTSPITSEIYDSDFQKVNSCTATGSINTTGVSVTDTNIYEPGVYYIKFTCNTAGTAFKYKNSFKATNTSDGLENNKIEHAKSIGINKTTKASISMTDKFDYFKIVMPAAGTLKVSFNSYVNDKMTATLSNGELVHLYTGIVSYKNTGSSNTEFSYCAEIPKGTYYLYVSADSSNCTGTYNIKVSGDIPITKISFKKSSVSVKKGKSVQLQVKITPSAANEEYTFTSMNKKIATVSSTGKVKGVKSGSTKIKVMTKEGELVAYCKVTVKK